MLNNFRLLFVFLARQVAIRPCIVRIALAVDFLVYLFALAVAIAIVERVAPEAPRAFGQAVDLSHRLPGARLLGFYGE